MHWTRIGVVVIWLAMLTTASAQTVATGDSGTAIVPALVRYTGAAPGHAGERLSLEFSIYAAPGSGSALWSERQAVEIGGDGSYTVLLGAGSSIALPASVFAAGQARWLGVRIGSGEELPRVLLSSVPYAMKAADADTLAGRKASDFLTQDEFATRLKQAADQVDARPQTAGTNTTATPTGGGTAGYLPLWSGAETLTNSGLFQAGSGAQAEFGIGTTSPRAALDVNGSVRSRGVLETWDTMAVETDAVATAANGVNSPILELEGSAFNSGTATAAPQRFAWQVAAVGNNTAAPGANLNLLYGTGGPAPTGLSISPKGIFTFAAGQTFPGAVSTTGIVNAGSYDLGGSRFAYGNQNGNSFLGFAGNGGVPSSIDNTAVGYEAMTALTGGGSNTAVGSNALDSISTGIFNTALGSNAGATYSNLNDSTAIGANSFVSQNDSLVLGQTAAGSPGTTYVSVGIGTATPASELELSKSASDALGPVLTLTNPAGDGASAAIDFKTYLHQSTLNSPTARILAQDDNNYGTNFFFLSKEPGSDFNPLQINMSILSNGQVSIGQPLSQDVNDEVNNQAELTVQGNGGEYAFDGIVGVGGAGSVGGVGGVFVGGTNELGLLAISSGSYAALFQGDVFVNGTLQASTKNFKIDHPSDPANKYLVHASVESSEMMNIYSGNVVTDELGLAIVKLPDWFQAENGDFRYQLTTIGRDAHAWIAEEVSGNQFKIATNATFVKVSWQITAVRQDAFAKARPLVVEQEKAANERGYYLHPELYGQPEEKQMEWAHRPDLMRRLKARREAARRQQTSQQKKTASPAGQ